jgi:hypothetical protein
MPALIPVVPAKDRRHLHYGMKGNDVKAYGRLLHRTLLHLGLKTINAQSGVYGDGLLVDTLALQRRLKIKADGTVGVSTWQAVDPQMHAYERLLLQLPAPPPAKNGVKIAAQMRAMLVLRMLVYSQARPAATNARRVPPARRLLRVRAARPHARRRVAVRRLRQHRDDLAELRPRRPGQRRARATSFSTGPGSKTTHTAVVSDVKGNRSRSASDPLPGRESDWRYRHDIMGFRRGA